MSKVRIVKSVACLSFPYGLLTDEEKAFVSDNIGEEFYGTRENMNYYRLKNGMKVHVYNIREVDEETYW